MKDLKKIFECTRCGFCCHGETTVSLDADDQQRMIKELKLSRDQVTERYWRVTVNVVQMQTVTGHCIFFNDGCTVHNGRPWRCAQWPLVPAILDDKNNFITISQSCPGIKKDVTYDDFCKILREHLDKAGKISC